MRLSRRAAVFVLAALLTGPALRAQESKPASDVQTNVTIDNAKFAKPAAEVRLTDKNGKTTVMKVSQADGDDIYIRVEGRPEVYKLGKTMLESFNYKIEDAIQ